MRAAIQAHDILRFAWIAPLTCRHCHPPLPCPVRRGCFREALLKQDGMRRPARLCMHTVAREATGNPPSITTDGREVLAGPVTTKRRQRREVFIPRGTGGQ